MENQYDVKHIMNSTGTRVIIYNIEGKNYCNYLNSCKLFKLYAENNKDLEFEILVMTDKSNKDKKDINK